MANSNLAHKLIFYAEEAITAFLADASADFAAFFAPVLTSLLILYLVFWGYQHLFGRAKETLQEGFWRVCFIAIIVTFSSSVAVYNGQIVPFFLGAGDQVAGFFNNTIPAGYMIDSFFNRGYEVALKLWNKAGVTEFGFFLMAALTWVAVAFLTGVAVFLVLLAKMMTAILLAIGPLFIVALLFQATKNFFTTWLSQLVNYTLIIVLTTLVLKLMLGLMVNYMDFAKTDTATLMASVSLITLIIVGILVLLQVTSIAAGLAGGIAASTMGAIGATVSKVSGGGRWLGGNLRPSIARERMRKVSKGVRTDRAALRAAGNTMLKPFRRNSIYNK